MFMNKIIIGVIGIFIGLTLGVVILPSVNNFKTDMQETKIIKQRGMTMIINFDKRKKRCEEMGGKYNIVETNTYYNEWCSGYLFERTY